MHERDRFLAVAVVVVLASLILPAVLRAPLQAEETSLPPVSRSAIQFAVSPPIADLPPAEEVKPSEESDDKELKQRPIKAFRPEGVDAGSGSIDGAVQPPGPLSRIEAANIPVPTVNFDGLSNQDNQNLFGFRVSPPTPTATWGPITTSRW
jgi:hypothetical protein